MEEREAIVYLNNGQRKCGRVVGMMDSGEVSFISNSLEELLAIGITQPIESISGDEILEIDFCLK